MPSRQIPSRKLGGDKSAFQSEFHIICFFSLMEQKIRAFLDGLERRSHHHHQFSEIRVQPVFGMDVSVMDWSVDASFSKSPAFSLSLSSTRTSSSGFFPLSHLHCLGLLLPVSSDAAAVSLSLPLSLLATATFSPSRVTRSLSCNGRGGRGGVGSPCVYVGY